MNALPSLTEIEAAARLIAPAIPPTPTYAWPLLREALGCEVWVKHENHTPLGAFKIRGGAVYLDELLRECAMGRRPKLAGVVAASTGNHGQSIAWNAQRRGVRAVIVVPHGNNPEKNAVMRALGAELVEHGDEFQHALEYSRELAERDGLHAVPSFHAWLVRGVATYGLELFRTVQSQAAELDVVYVPIGLGSGFCGLAAAREALGLKTRLVGVVSAHVPAYALSFREKRLVTEPSKTKVAEGVACSTPHELALQWILRNADDVVTVSDDEAVAALGELLRTTHNLAEGAGAVALAAIRKDRAKLAGRSVGCILSGGNASAALVARACSGH